MLFEKLDQICTNIESITDQEIPVFREQLIEKRPDFYLQLTDKHTSSVADPICLALSTKLLQLVKDIPVITRSLVEASQNTAIHPAMRCAIVGSLAYLAQPLDMICDYTRAGFGFVDDCMLLRATVGEYFDILPVGFTSLHLERYHQLLMAICIPVDQLDAFQSTIDGVWRMFQYLLGQSPAKSTETMQTLMRNPLDFDLMKVTDNSDYKPGPNITHPPGPENFSIVDEQITISFPTGGQLILPNPKNN